MEQFLNLPLTLPFLFFQFFLGFRTFSSVLPTHWQLTDESLYRTILSLQKTNVGRASFNFFPLIFTLFTMIFISNYVGMIPYSATASTEIVICLTQAFTLLIGIFIFGLFHQGFFLIFHIFLPAGIPQGLLPLMIPLEILAYLTRTFSLGLRQAVNIITGHVLVKVGLSFLLIIPKNIIQFFGILLLIILFLALEILIAYLQAYIFIFITQLTLRDILGV